MIAGDRDAYSGSFAEAGDFVPRVGHLLYVWSDYEKLREAQF